MESLVAVRANGRIVSDYESALKDDAHWYLTAAFFTNNRITLPKVDPLVYAGREYYPLDAVAGLTFSVNSQEQTLDIEIPAVAFGKSLLDASRRPRFEPTPSQPGLFLNHDVQYLTGNNLNQFSGLFEGGMFSRFGVFTSEFSAVNKGSTMNLTRIDSLFTHDSPDKMATLVAGDTISSGEMWARPVYFAGLLYTRNFAVQPAFIPEVLPGVTGVAVQPSVVDIYADNIKLLSQTVDAGPFAIQNIPVMSGQGDIQVVVTDVLGRSETITQPFVKSTSLLQKKVTDFSYEAGIFRTNYGVASNQYRSLFAGASQLRGMTDSLTMGVRSEMANGGEALGVSANYGMAKLGIAGGGVVLSMDKTRPGALAYVDFSHAARAFGFAVHGEKTTPGFWQIGLQPTEANGRQLVQASVTHAVGNRGTVSAGFIQEILHNAGDLRAMTATAGVRVGPGYLSVTPTLSTAPRRTTGVNFSFTIPLGRRQTVLATADTGNAGRSAPVEVQRSLPAGTGYGYRVRSDALNHGRVDAEFSYQNDHGEWDVEGSQSAQGNSWRLSDRAGLAWLDGHLLMARWLQDSFALVEVPHQANVGVFVNNLQVARTNHNGVALIPWLVPYDRNSVRIDDSAVSMDTILDISDKIVVPSFRSGVLVKFTPQKSAGATLILKTSTGELVPLGAQVKVGSTVAGQVAYHGEVFLPLLTAPASLRVEWPDHACELVVTAIPNEVLPRLGPLLCTEAK
jgi:outer membrane usher protein